MEKLSVAVLGATGVVGQKIIALLQNHPYFTLNELVASDRSKGKAYGDACQWREALPEPAGLSQKKLVGIDEITSKVVLSALPSGEALEMEPYLAAKGMLVSSNASTFRMHPEVPLLIPGVNDSQLEKVKLQKSSGKIVTNPNCSATIFASALMPLLRLGTLERVDAVTMQAVSGAGYPGVSSMDILGEIIPHIEGEEKKIEEEMPKILSPHQFEVFCHVHRVPVLHGHSVCFHARFHRSVRAEEAASLFREMSSIHPMQYAYHEEVHGPRPRRDLHPADFRVHVGRIRQSPGDDRVIGMLAVGHNLVLGAAGACIENGVNLHRYMNNGGML